MLYAMIDSLIKVRAYKKGIGICPNCNKEVIAKCGDIKIWHWCHKYLGNCDWFSDGETEWHLYWKEQVPSKYCEIKIGNHRADICINGFIIELQNSPISPKKIWEREQEYVNMIWLFRKKFNNDIMELNYTNNFKNFRLDWKHFLKSLLFIKKRLFIQFEENDEDWQFILEIKQIIKSYKSGYILYGDIWRLKLFKKTFLDNIKIMWS